MKDIIVLGVSGSIGQQCVEIIEQRKNMRLLGFSFFNNYDYALKLLKTYPQIKYVCGPQKHVEKLKEHFPNTKFFTNLDDLAKIKAYLVVVALVGFSALKPTLAAIKAQNDIALANKECIVGGGNLLFDEIKKYQVNVFTMDSELNAIEQCLNGEKKGKVKKVILTASGGPFINKSLDELQQVTINEVIAHPNWSMGVKISIDSANLCNKILEVIETSYYFNLDFKDIEIVIQPTSYVHSMVEFEDNSVMMQMSKPSMLLPISYALEKYERESINNYESVDFGKLRQLEFIEPNINHYPILEVLNIFDKNKPCLFIAFNALNEYFNKLFRSNIIRFLDISNFIVAELKKVEVRQITNLEDVFSYHQQIIKSMEEKYEFDFNDN